MELCNGSLYQLLEKPENAFGVEECNFKQFLFDVGEFKVPKGIELNIIFGLCMLTFTICQCFLFNV